MQKSALYTWLAVVSFSVGIGMILGHNLGNSTQNTATWVGGFLTFLGAVTLGMAVASRNTKGHKSEDNTE